MREPGHGSRVPRRAGTASNRPIPMTIAFAARRFVPAVLLALLSTLAQAASQAPVMAENGMVVTAQHLATRVGVDVLKDGGNAVDAAVAVGFAMAVTHPFAGNLGGGGYMLIRMADGRATFLDFRERAPEKASRNMYLDAKGELTKESVEGWRSSGVPGTVRGFEMAVSKYGKRKWAENMAPAVELASKGFPISYAISESLKGSKSLASSPESKRIFQKNGAFYDVGDTLVQPELANNVARVFTQLRRSPVRLQFEFAEARGKPAHLVLFAVAVDFLDDAKRLGLRMFEGLIEPIINGCVAAMLAYHLDQPLGSIGGKRLVVHRPHLVYIRAVARS